MNRLAFVFVWLLSLVVLVNTSSFSSEIKAALDAVLESDNLALKSVLEKGAAVDATNEAGETALIWASYMGNEQAANLLLNHGANPHHHCTSGISPLMAAASNGHIAVVELLLSRTGHSSKDALQFDKVIAMAQGKDQMDAARLIQRFKEAILTQAAGSETITRAINETLLRACNSGDLDTVKKCLQEGAQPDGEGLPGSMTPLVVGIAAGQKEVVDTLIEHGANINAPVKDDWTPFITACHYGHTTIAKMLIDLGADVDARTKDGWSGLELATAKKHTDTSAMLMKALMGLPWAQTQAKRPDQSDGRLCLRKNPSTSSPKVGCVKMGDALSLNGFGTKDGWVQVISPFEGWIKEEKIETSGLPKNNRGLLMVQTKNDLPPKTNAVRKPLADDEFRGTRSEHQQQDTDETSAPGHFRRHNWR